MTDTWHYTTNGQQHGPVSSAELRSLARHGFITPNDLVWKTGMANWKQAGQLKGLFPAAMVVEPKPPPSSMPLIAVTAGPKPRPSGKRTKYVVMLIPMTVIAIGTVLVTKVSSYLTPLQVITRTDGAGTTERGRNDASGNDGLPAVRSSTEQESHQAIAKRTEEASQVLKRNVRSITPGMTRAKVLETMGERPDVDYELQVGAITAINTSANRDGSRMYWDTGTLGITIHLDTGEGGGERVWFVSDADSGYYMSRRSQP